MTMEAGGGRGGGGRPPRPPPPSPSRPIPSRSIFSADLRATSSGILLLITLLAFEAIGVSAAMPTAARHLHGISAYGWAFTGFLVASVVGMVASGQLSDTSGPRRPLVGGMLGFLLGLAVSGSATTMTQLVCGRFIQGVGTGLLITAVYVVIGETYPHDLQPGLFAAISSAWVVPSLVGPLIAGALAQHVSWRWVFLGLLPFAALGAALLLPVLRRLAPHRPRRPHQPGEPPVAPLGDPPRLVRALAAAIGIAAMEQAGQHPSAPGIAVAVVGVVLLTWGLRPLLPAGTVRVRRGVPAPVAMRGIAAGAFFGIESIVPLSLTVQHHFAATTAALPLAGAGLFWALGSWIQGQTERRVLVVRTGFVCIAVAGVLVALAVQPGLPGWLMYPAWAFAGTGAGLTITSASVLLLRYTTDAERGADSAALQLSDACSSAVTTGFAGVLVAAAARGTLGYTGGFTVIALVLGALALLGAAVAGQVRPPEIGTADGPAGRGSCGREGDGRGGSSVR